MKKLFILILIVIILGSFFSFLNKTFPNAINSLNSAQLVSGIVILALNILAFSGRNIGFTEITRNILAWVSIFFIAILGYSYRHIFLEAKNEVISELIPAEATQNNNGSVSFKRSLNNHFMIDALVNGVKINFLLDTGASFVTLTGEDARSLGVDTSKLYYGMITSTANGNSSAAYFNIKEFKVGEITINNLNATISKSGLDQSLLGMSFLNRLSSYEVSKDTLTLKN